MCRRRSLPPLALAEIEPRRDRAVDPFWVSRQSLDADAAVLKPGCGWLPPEWMPEDGAAPRHCARWPAPTRAVLTDYGRRRGSPALRQLLPRASPKHGIEASPDQIMLTESGTQAIDLICRFLLRPGDTVLVDDPCYFNFHALLRAHRAKIVSVPYTPSGPTSRASSRCSPASGRGSTSPIRRSTIRPARRSRRRPRTGC